MWTHLGTDRWGKASLSSSSSEKDVVLSLMCTCSEMCLQTKQNKKSGVIVFSVITYQERILLCALCVLSFIFSFCLLIVPCFQSLNMLKSLRSSKRNTGTNILSCSSYPCSPYLPAIPLLSKRNNSKCTSTQGRYAHGRGTCGESEEAGLKLR